YELWPLTLEDAIDTTGRAFLGLTLRCARCHDHKFDPVTKEDYYALYGVFASTQFPWAGGEEFASMKRPREHFQPVLPPDEAAPPQAAYRKRQDRLRDEISCLKSKQADLEFARQEDKDPKLDQQLRENKARLDRLREEFVNLRKSSLP